MSDDKRTSKPHRARVSDDEWEDTPVDPIETEQFRRHPGAIPIVPSLAAASDDSPRQSASARAALAKITDLNKKFDEHSKADKAALDKIDARLEQHSEMFTGIRVDQAALKGSVDTLVGELRHQRSIQKLDVEQKGTERVELIRAGATRTGWRYKALIALIGGTGGFGIGALLQRLLS